MDGVGLGLLTLKLERGGEGEIGGAPGLTQALSPLLTALDTTSPECLSPQIEAHHLPPPLGFLLP